MDEATPPETDAKWIFAKIFHDGGTRVCGFGNHLVVGDFCARFPGIFPCGNDIFSDSIRDVFEQELYDAIIRFFDRNAVLPSKVPKPRRFLSPEEEIVNRGKIAISEKKPRKNIKRGLTKIVQKIQIL